MIIKVSRRHQMQSFRPLMIPGRRSCYFLLNFQTKANVVMTHFRAGWSYQGRLVQLVWAHATSMKSDNKVCTNTIGQERGVNNSTRHENKYSTKKTGKRIRRRG